MNQPALCPSCKKDVVFDTAGDVSVCPECGARFELTSETPLRKKRLTPREIILFAVWLFAPALAALFAFAVLRTAGTRNLNDVFGRQNPSVWVVSWTIFSIISCYSVCSWITGRFTSKVVVSVAMGLFLGAGVLFCNAVIALFSGCVFFTM